MENKELPILFNTEMVKAILEGRKTQTRRPFGLPGGIEIPGITLWVRETWCSVDDTEYEGSHWVDYKASPRYPESDGPAGWDRHSQDPDAAKWRPSIHMPRRYARIFLTVTDYYEQHLFDMTQEDAFEEGVTLKKYTTYKKEFFELWNSIYAQHYLQSYFNPKVWVVKFKLKELWGYDVQGNGLKQLIHRWD